MNVSELNLCFIFLDIDEKCRISTFFFVVWKNLMNAYCKVENDLSQYSRVFNNNTLDNDTRDSGFEAV